MNHFCRKASQLQSDEFERELTLGERFKLRMHLLMCGACQNYSENLRLLNRIFRDHRRTIEEDEIITLPESKREQIKKSLKEASDSDT